MINEQMKYEMNHDTDHENKSVQEDPKNAFDDEKIQLVKHNSENNKVISENLKGMEPDERNNAQKSFQHRREKFKKMDQKQRIADVNFNKGNVFNILNEGNFINDNISKTQTTNEPKVFENEVYSMKDMSTDKKSEY